MFDLLQAAVLIRNPRLFGISMSMDLEFLSCITISDRIAHHAQPGMCLAIPYPCRIICKLRKCRCWFEPDMVHETWAIDKSADVTRSLAAPYPWKYTYTRHVLDHG